MALTVEQAKEILDHLDEGEVYEGYSGRGMYGKTCVGIVTKESPIKVGYAAAKAGIPEKDLPLRSDNMGLSTIYY
jgi:hypothetical protein